MLSFVKADEQDKEFIFMATNQGFLDRAKQKPEETFSNNFANVIFKFIPEKGTPYHVKWLTDLDSALPLQVHFPNIICEKMYSDCMGCSECEKTVSYKGVERPNTPKRIWALIGYVYDLAGKTYTSKKTNKEYPENPIKIIEISSGKKDINFENLEQYHNSGILMDDVWIVKRLVEGGMDKPAPADVRLLHNFSSEIHPDFLEKVTNINSMSDAEKRGLIFASYANARFGHPDIVEAGFIKPEGLDDMDLEGSTTEDPLDD